MVLHTNKIMIIKKDTIKALRERFCRSLFVPWYFFFWPFQTLFKQSFVNRHNIIIKPAYIYYTAYFFKCWYCQQHSLIKY
jgi:hypothetical protein